MKDIPTVICITGPQAAGRTAVVDRFLQLYTESMNKQQQSTASSKTNKLASNIRKTKFLLNICKYTTTAAELVSQYPDKYEYMDKNDFQTLRLTSSLAPPVKPELIPNSNSNSNNSTTVADVIVPDEALYIGKYKTLFQQNDTPVSNMFVLISVIIYKYI